MPLVYRPAHPAANDNGMVERDIAGPRSNAKHFAVMPDITPFRSPIDKSWITSRSALREHERVHGVRQVGNDFAAHMQAFRERVYGSH